MAVPVPKYVSRISGMELQLNNPLWLKSPDYYSTEVRPHGRLTDSVMIPIPTPVQIDGDHVKALSAHVRFQTGPGVSVKKFFVHDGPSHMLGITLSPPLRHSTTQDYQQDIPRGSATVKGAVVIDLEVEFPGTGFDDYIKIVHAGVSFDNI
jgi:hypothetical protein